MIVRCHRNTDARKYRSCGEQCIKKLISGSISNHFPIGYTSNTMASYRRTLPLVLLLWGCLYVSATISPNVIAVQQVLSKELQTLEQSAFITTHSHSSPGENAFYRLRRVFHEFERQNQDSITAILRVLALIDQTLENTIQDCEKVFHLPSLESENVLFREVTRPLLLRVEKLCQQISSKDIASIEATMEEVEMEANVYQRLLGETMSDMRSLQHELDIADRWSLDISVPAKIDALFDQMALVNSTICTEITAAFGSFVDHQRSLGETIGQNMRPEDNDELILAVSNYVTFLQNETTLLVQDIIEDLDDWFNETDVFLNLVAAEAANLPHKLLESPIEEFLLGESSLRCLAEFSNHVTVQRMSQELASILRCFNVSSDTKKPFDMALHLLSQLDSDIQLTLRGILTCQQSASFEGLDIDDYRNIMSCSEVTQSVLEAMENLIDAKLEEIVMHIDASMYFNELQMEMCVYYKFRDMLVDMALTNQHYHKCNADSDIEL